MMRELIKMIIKKNIRLNLLKKDILMCPLAFAEVGVKGRVKSVLNYKKPTFWIIIVAVIACVVVAAGFLTAPISENKDTVYESENNNSVSDSYYSSYNNAHVEKLALEEAHEYHNQLPSVDLVESIDMVIGVFPRGGRLKSITDREDIEMILEMLNEIHIIRRSKAEDQMYGDYGTYFLLKLDGDNTFKVTINSNIMEWQGTSYFADLGELEYSSDLFDQLDYDEVQISEKGLSMLH